MNHADYVVRNLVPLVGLLQVHANIRYVQTFIRQKDKERGSGSNVAKGAFLPCPLSSCNDAGHFEVPEVIDLLSSDEEDEVEVVSSPPSKTEEGVHVKREGCSK